MTSRSEMNEEVCFLKINDVINRTKACATQSNKIYKSNGDKKYALLMKAFIAILRDLNTICQNMYENTDNDVTRVFSRIMEVESVIDKLICKFPTGTILTWQDTDDDDDDKVLLQSIPCYGRRFEVLVSILEHIRAFEKTYTFQRQLWLEKKTLVRRIKCSLDQFAYGTTSFSLWRSLLDCKYFNMKIYVKPNPRVYFFGSSHGILCFYTSIYYPQCRCTGYEVLGSLFDQALCLKKTHKVGKKYRIISPHVSLYVSDLRVSPVSTHQIMSSSISQI